MVRRGWTTVQAVGGGGVDDDAAVEVGAEADECDDDAAVEVGAEADDVGGLQKIGSRQFLF